MTKHFWKFDRLLYQRSELQDKMNLGQKMECLILKFVRQRAFIVEREFYFLLEFALVQHMH